MRTRAPAVYEWVARMWNEKADRASSGELISPDLLLLGFVREISETHLSQLRQNAEAFSRGTARYDLVIQGTRYARVPTSRYRVWCLEMLRQEWNRLDQASQRDLQNSVGGGEFDVLLKDVAYAASEYDVEGLAPFNRAIHVFGSGVPPWFRRSL